MTDEELKAKTEAIAREIEQRWPDFFDPRKTHCPMCGALLPAFGYDDVTGILWRKCLTATCVYEEGKGT